MLLRVGASDDDDEPGEDLLLRDVRGEALAVAASAALHRVWVADLTGAEDTSFGAPNTTVVHSAIDTLEDGPRTEVRPTRVPYAEFARMTFERTTERQSTVWNTTLSASPTRGESTCVPGAWAARFDARERPIALPSPDVHAPEAWMRSLVAEPLRSCDDRVHSAWWEQSHLVALVSGPRLGVQLVVGDVTHGAPRSVVLDSEPVLRAGAVRATQGVFAVWLAGNARSPALRCRYFTNYGEARGEALTLGEIAEAPTDVSARDTLPVGGARGRYAALLRTSHGPRVARIDCGE
jgi:hypothetical protein